jgi:hypothetical protein
MSKTRNRSKDQWIRYKKLEQENKKLKKELSKLRKLVNNSVIDHLEEREQKVREGRPTIMPLCENCGNEDIRSIPVKRQDGNFEIVVCSSCSHRSELKKIKKS